MHPNTLQGTLTDFHNLNNRKKKTKKQQKKNSIASGLLKDFHNAQKLFLNISRDISSFTEIS